MTGVVKFFDKKKRFGFITGEDGKDTFVHESDVEGPLLIDGQNVEYDILVANGRAKAKNVRVRPPAELEPKND